MEDTQIFGTLFNTIPLNDEGHLNAILSSMDKDTATYYLVQAVRHAYNSGVYTMGEVEVLSKSIRVCSRKDDNE